MQWEKRNSIARIKENRHNIIISKKLRGGGESRENKFINASFLTNIFYIPENSVVKSNLILNFFVGVLAKKI